MENFVTRKEIKEQEKQRWMNLDSAPRVGQRFDAGQTKIVQEEKYVNKGLIRTD